MPDIAIRPAWPDDLPQIASIYDHYVRSTTVTLEETPPDHAGWSKRYWSLAERGLPFFVAELNGRVAGYAYCAPWKARSAYRYCVEESIYLAPWATGRRTGGVLLDRTLEECARIGMREVIAVLTMAPDAVDSNSFRLHRSRGFDVAGRLSGVGVKHGTTVDTVIMQRTLSEGFDTNRAESIDRPRVHA
ncbi:N-acetyltransferase [Nocardia cyriacigeorgica]|uniref:GNAT family N-acetyltransferase n=1 Tax=Nocardia cyriacigeorgica TaxID=135487 RepID=UPI0018947A61|nr:GNAT family N-acetyltransferase [Nocardia cyriacigeorgica]MBF6320515.1 N-acetyltransferase [Nocardia cyriacigeorgica]MBF6535002.1 N-acetyltransferase [Nocardia cyriacigeorgica]